jgi:hypothetical protein
MKSPHETSDTPSPHAEVPLTDSMPVYARAEVGDFATVLQAVMALPLDQSSYARLDALLQLPPAVSNPQFSWSRTVHLFCAAQANLLDLGAKVQARLQAHRSTRGTAVTRCSEPSEEQDQALLVRIQQTGREVDDMIENMVWI